MLNRIPGGPEVKTPYCMEVKTPYCRGYGLTPGPGTKITHTVGCGQKQNPQDKNH